MSAAWQPFAEPPSGDGKDPSFEPQPGDWVSVGDDEEPSLRARVTRRAGNRVWVQLTSAWWDQLHADGATSTPPAFQPEPGS